MTVGWDTYDDVSGEVDPVGHGGDLLEGIQHGSIGAAHGSPILVLGISKLIKARCTCSLKYHIENIFKNHDENTHLCMYAL